MSKGIAIQTILLLMVGTLVAGILIYLVYSYTRSPTLSKTECIAEVTNWCTTCMISGWNKDIECPQDVKDCGNLILGNEWWTGNDNCATGGAGTPEEALRAIKEDCKVTVGVG